MKVRELLAICAAADMDSEVVLYDTLASEHDTAAEAIDADAPWCINLEDAYIATPSSLPPTRVLVLDFVNPALS